MKLSDFERETVVWKKIEEELAGRLTVFRQKNDGNLDEKETAKLRGQIALCKEILAWALPDPQI